MTTPHPLSGVPVLVTGATGFIGARLVERLVLQGGAQVRVLVRTVAGAMRLARLPVEIVVGDLRDTQAVAGAAEGCAVLFNCVKGAGRDPPLRRAADVEGVRHLIDAARARRARLVHLSSFAVYDLPDDGEVTERTPTARRGDPYADAKLEGERLALRYGGEQGVPVVVLQPTVVYGPFATVHGADILNELWTSQMILVDGGEGVCNAVYVDDVVTAMMQAAASARAVGQRLLISGAEHPRWRDFIGGFERMLGTSRTVTMTQDEALALWQATRRRPWLLPEIVGTLKTDRAVRKRLLATREGTAIRQLAERVAPKALSRAEQWAAGPVASGRAAHLASPTTGPSPIRPWLIRYLAKRARVRIDAARDLLGYEPAFSLAAGMRLTEAWARWAGLVRLEKSAGAV